MADAAAEALMRTRRAVAAAADELQRRYPQIPLDEKKGAKDWQRLRAEMLSEMKAAGPDWVAAFEYEGNIEAAPAYDQAQVLLDNVNGAPQSTLKHVRQRAMLASLADAWSSCGFRILQASPKLRAP